jgi:preprotein translocase subunit SecG
LSEAAASGADEALAYDSLKALGREDEWAQVLERTTFVVSIGFFTTMILGAFAYDPAIVNRMLALLNTSWQLPDSLVIRLPVILTLLTAGVVLVTAMGFYDLDAKTDSGADQGDQGRAGVSLLEPFRQILSAARWTVGHRFVLFVILAALALDSVARQFAVLSSEYYRLIDIPVSWFGFVGAGMSLIGILNARISRYLVSNRSPLFNFLVLSALLMSGLVGISFAVPYFGVLFAVGAFAMMGMVQFQASYYLNREADSDIRATVLSFKGLALNLGLGIASLLYTALVASLRNAQEAGMSEEIISERVFVDSLAAFPMYYVVLFVVLVIAAKLSIGNCAIFFKSPSE